MKIIASSADYFKNGRRPEGTSSAEVVSSKTSDPLVEFNWSDKESSHMFRIRQSELFQVVEAMKAGLL